MSTKQIVANRIRRMRKSLPRSCFCGPNRTYPCFDASHVRGSLHSLHIRKLYLDVHEGDMVKEQYDGGLTQIKRIHNELMEKAKRLDVVHNCEFTMIPIPITFIYEGELLYEGLLQA